MKYYLHGSRTKNLYCKSDVHRIYARCPYKDGYCSVECPQFELIEEIDANEKIIRYSAVMLHCCGRRIEIEPLEEGKK